MSNLNNNTTQLEALLAKVNALPEAGNDTSDATATSSDILSGKTAYVDGEKVTGTIATKTSSNLTVNGATVTVPAGYYATQATKSVATATQATPIISVNSSTGLITATATQTAGYVTAGTKSATSQLAFQAAQTITPGTVDKTIAAGKYLTGVQTIKGDTNLVANNIKTGVTIFGIAGNYEGGGGSSGEASDYSEAEDAMVTGAITTYTNDRVKSIHTCAFYSCTSLRSVNFPACTSIGISAFQYCYSLRSVNFPACTSIGNDAFQYCSSLTSVNFPACTNIGNDAFYYCSSLTSVNFPVCTNIGNDAFHNCRSLASVSFPACINIDNYAFYNCSSLTSVNFPVCTNISNDAFRNCSSLISVNFPACTSIGSYAFNYCSSLTSVYLGSNIPSTSTTIKVYIYSSAFYMCLKLTNLTLYYPSVVTLSNVNAFTSTPMSLSTLTGAFGSIYVPASLVAAYKAATNWATYADRITAIPGTEGDGEQGGSGEDTGSGGGNDGDASLISFTISNTSYQAEEGMTWGEWCDSEYNTAGFTISGGKVYYGGRMVSQVSNEDVIIANKVYSLLMPDPGLPPVL